MLQRSFIASLNFDNLGIDLPRLDTLTIVIFSVIVTVGFCAALLNARRVRRQRQSREMSRLFQMR